MSIPDCITILAVILLLTLILLEIRHKVVVGKLPDPSQPDLLMWKWGIFYFNPEDPRTVVPKRIPSLGWTLNFARPASYAFFVALILVILVVGMIR